MEQGNGFAEYIQSVFRQFDFSDNELFMLIILKAQIFWFYLSKRKKRKTCNKDESKLVHLKCMIL